MRVSTKSADSAPQEGDAVVVGTTTNRPKLSMPSRKYVLAILAIIIVIAGSITFMMLRSSGAKLVCSDSLLKEANTQNKLGNASAFGLIAGQIEADASYTSDPNCMYAIAEYQITMGNLTTAKTTIDNLTSHYGTKYVFNSNLDDGHASISNLQNQFNIVQNVQVNAKGKIDPKI